MLMKNKTTNFGTGAFYVLVGAMLHAAPINSAKNYVYDYCN
jgi:hypothetical protein